MRLNLHRLGIVNRPFDVVLVVTLVGAATLRLRALLANRSLWLDEVFLATGVRDLSFLQLLTESLPYNQSAPPGFLLATRLGVSTLGTDLMAIRIVPFASGLLVLVVALLVARLAFQRRTSQLFFLLLIGVSPALVYYSTEFKQYSSDALLVLVALHVALVGRRPEIRWLVPALGFVAALASVPGSLAFASLGLAILLHAQLVGGVQGLLQALSCWRSAFLAWGLGAVLHFALTFRAGTDRDAMFRWWSVRGGFPPDGVDAFERLSWYFERPVELVWMLLFPHGPIGSQVGKLPAVVLVAASLLVGFALLRQSFRTSLPATFLGILVAFAWLMSELHLYPLSSRVMIYLLPVLAFTLASGYDVGICWRRATQPLSAVAMIILVLSAGASSIAPFTQPVLSRDMRAIVQLLERELRDGDVVVVNSSSSHILEWHDPEGVVPRDVVYVTNHESIKNPEYPFFRSRQPERIWVIATHRRSEALQIARTMSDGYSEPAIFDNDLTLIVLMSRSDVAFISTGDRRLVEVTEE